MDHQAPVADLFRNPPHRYVDVGGAEVACRTVGNGPDVLFVHGWPVSGATFRHLLPHLVDHVTCHVVDLPGTGSSRFSTTTPLSLDLHIHSVRRVVDELGVQRISVVGHDSGGMIARHALAGDARLRSMGLIDTEQSNGVTLRFRSFVAIRHLPGLAGALGWVAAHPRVRRHPLVFGAAFADPSLLDGEFAEFFLDPLQRSPDHRAAAAALLRSFRYGHVRELADLHRQIRVPVQLVWGALDKFFPVERAKRMVETFADARLEIIEGAGLLAQEERPAEVARALLPVLTGGEAHS
ncbi:MAG: hypothetical protein RL219_255 [Actinomycetota bacterium]|jgi:pimeloyl-ACP methyl ester carboxylesterase